MIVQPADDSMVSVEPDTNLIKKNNMNNLKCEKRDVISLHGSFG